jgi:uncharacterized protein YjbI with pentapeptide repeats
MIAMALLGGALAWGIGAAYNSLCMPNDMTEVPICMAFKGGGPWPLVLTGIAAAPSVLLTWFWRDTGQRVIEEQKRQDIRQARMTYRLEVQAKIAARFQAASALLVADNPLARIAGLHALWDIARESHNHRPTVRLALAAFIRVQAPIPEHEEPDLDPTVYPPAADVHVAATLLFNSRWKEWLPGHSADLRRTRLAAANLKGAYMSGVDLEDAEICQSNLDDADLSKANLKGANLCKATLRNANLDHADLGGAYLNEAHLSDAQCGSANFASARIGQASLARTDLTNANLLSVNADDSDFRRAQLRGAKLQFSSLKHANFRRANLDNATLVSADLSDADLTQASIRGVKNTRTKVVGAKLPTDWKQ